MTLLDCDITLPIWDRADGYLSRRWPLDELPPEWFVLDERYQQRRFSWAVRRFGACTVGRITLRPFVDDHLRNAAWIGIYIAPHARRLGLGSRALSQFLDTVPPSFDLSCLYADIHTDNDNSFALFAKYGFHFYDTSIRFFNSHPQVFILLKCEVI